MAILYVDGKRLKRQIRASAHWLVAHEDALNRLNVFPVPDGDTGTNMGYTLKAVVRAISESHLGDDLSDIANTVANSALLGARGNSGVILSQIFNGFAEGIGDKKRANAMDIAYSLKKACEKAYAAVTTPIEGTILTVVREGVDAAYEKARTEADIAIIIETLLSECKRSLANTPNLLPALKAANVVDAGAMGFVFIIEGIHRLLTGAELPEIALEKPKPNLPKSEPGQPTTSPPLFYGYCHELFIHGPNLNLGEIRAALMSLGDSLVLAEGAGQVKIHIHSRRPGSILERCQQWGILSDIKIENMDEQHAGTKEMVSPKSIVVIAVAMGEGLRRIFESLGCDHVIQGGQTMNPSVQELSDAVTETARRFGASQFVLLPNNGNVLFSAEQACGFHKDKNVVVIPTHTIPEGFSALMVFDREINLETNARNMRQAIRQVKTGEVTRAVKEYQTDTLNIRIGDTIGIHQNKILGVYADPQTAVRNMVKLMVSDDDAIISLYHGEDTPEDRAKALADEMAKEYPDLDVELHHGGQPHYAYIISIE